MELKKDQHASLLQSNSHWVKDNLRENSQQQQYSLILSDPAQEVAGLSVKKEQILDHPVITPQNEKEKLQQQFDDHNQHQISDGKGINLSVNSTANFHSASFTKENKQNNHNLCTPMLVLPIGVNRPLPSSPHHFTVTIPEVRSFLLYIIYFSHSVCPFFSHSLTHNPIFLPSKHDFIIIIISIVSSSFRQVIYNFLII